MHFKDREDAGLQLAEALKQYKGRAVIVYALPRGGVILGVAIAKKLGAKFDLIITRKIGHPDNPEYAIAAVAENGDIVSNQTELSRVDQAWFKQAVEEQRQEAKRRRQLYLKNRKPINARGKTCIIVDDGLATGLTMKVAIKELRHQKPKAIIAALPVAPAEAVKEISRLADEVVALYAPADFFGAIAAYYQNFNEVTDEEVVLLIKRFNHVAV